MFEWEIDLFWEIKRLSSTKEIIKMGILRIFKQFSRIWKIDERIDERADSCPTPTSTLQKGDWKLFQKYFVFLSTR